MLQILLFGSFEARRDGQSLSTRWARRADRLLALLTINHNRAVSMDWIAVALRLGEQVLPQSLGELRELLGDDGQRLQRAKHQLYFDTTTVDVDLFEFQRQFARGTPSSLEAAVRLYRGALLRDWEEEGWFGDERESCMADYLDAINTLAHAAREAGDHDRAASLLRRYVIAYPEMDSAWARLIEVYSEAGNTSVIETVRQEYLNHLIRRSEAEGRPIPPSERVLKVAAPIGFAKPGQEAADGIYSLTGVAHQWTRAEDARAVLEPPGGVVPLNSPYYVVRPADDEIVAALSHQDSFVLVKGARQVGKSSLLARAQQRAREMGATVVRTDWQKVARASLETSRTFLLDLADEMADQLDLEVQPQRHFAPERTPTRSFERFIKREILPTVPHALVWIMDEADRLFDTEFRDDIFAMLRSWHGEREADSTGLWRKLTVVIAYATEAYLFISNMDQSPFNIGVRIDLDDFTREQVSDLNRRYGAPLRDTVEMDRLMALVGGHPYLIRRALHEIVLNRRTLTEMEQSSEGLMQLFGDHLNRLALALRRDPMMLAAVHALLDGSAVDSDCFLRLRAAGVVRGATPESARLRCRLYEQALRQMPR